MMLTLERAAGAASAEIRNAQAFPKQLRVVTDTRSLQSGDVFLALRGERFDGHAFVQEAREQGAAAFVVDDPSALPADAAALVVRDTKRAYMDIAGAARELYTGRAIAITGSAGKTTTKHLIAQLLAAHFGKDRVLASPANENNEIGVSKLLLAASAQQHDVLVIEMGARHEGEIAELVQIARPHIGVLTNIGEAHLEIFGSRERLARTKWGLFSQGAQAVLNAEDSESRLRAPALSSAPLWFGSGEPCIPGVWIVDEKTLLVSNGTMQQHSIALRLPGKHNRQNLAAAIAAALLAGMPIERIIETIPALTLPPGRYETIDLEGKPRLIYDAYNANTSGMLAALDAFAAERASRKIAVLASMAELGSDAPAMHERVGAHAARSGVDMLLVGGDFAESIAQGALASGLPRERIVAFRDNGGAAAWLREHAHAGDAVLFKGSRKYKMEEIIQELIR